MKEESEYPTTEQVQHATKVFKNMKKDRTVRVRIPEGYMPARFSMEFEKGKAYLVVECHDSTFRELLLEMLKKVKK